MLPPFYTVSQAVFDGKRARSLKGRADLALDRTDKRLILKTREKGVGGPNTSADARQLSQRGRHAFLPRHFFTRMLISHSWHVTYTAHSTKDLNILRSRKMHIQFQSTLAALVLTDYLCYIRKTFNVKTGKPAISVTSNGVDCVLQPGAVS